MDELVSHVASRTGISPEQARTAVDTVLRYLKARLPGPAARHIDAAASGEPGGGLTGAAQGLFGGRNHADS